MSVRFTDLTVCFISSICIAGSLSMLHINRLYNRVGDMRDSIQEHRDKIDMLKRKTNEQQELIDELTRLSKKDEKSSLKY